jgi:hypothetical protein
VLKNSFAIALLALVLPLSGCGTTMQDIALKAEKAKTKDQLEAALGKPDKFEKMKVGVSFESWTYTATDGEVNFTVINNKVQSTVTIPKKKDTKEGTH